MLDEPLKSWPEFGGIPAANGGAKADATQLGRLEILPSRIVGRRLRRVGGNSTPSRIGIGFILGLTLKPIFIENHIFLLDI